MKLLFVSVSLLVLQSISANAYYSFQDTGDLYAPGQYAVGAELQFITEDSSGANILGRFEGGWRDDFNFRGFVGLGEIDFQLGGFIKWVPIPDHGKQPAIGLSFGALYASYASDSELSLRAYPFLSKHFEVEFGQLTPYLTFPLGIRSYDGDSNSTAQMIIGSRFIHPDMAGAHYYAELGFDLDDAPTFISFGASFPLNDEMLIDLWP